MSYSTDIMPQTKLRFLRPTERNGLAAILQVNNSWKELAGIIRHPDKEDLYLYKADEISILDSQRKCGTPAQAFLEHWSIYGKNHPDISTLLKYLKEANLLRAAHFVEVELLKNNAPENDLTLEELETIVNGKPTNSFNQVQQELQQMDLNGLPTFPFELLARSTMNFSDLRVEKGGCKIGEGTYGVVFRADISTKVVAVKKLKNDVDKQFFTELKTLVSYKHENLLSLLGYSLSDPNCCLVYEYMENGSLQERLACYGNTSPLAFEMRLKIAYGSALGINHLHTFREEPMVHRDIKSANILLDEKFNPKVGDFGIVRVGDSNLTSTAPVTQNMIGTSVYMAREAFYGDVSIKLDTFSFGVVLLELLTALPPYDANREDRDLTSHMETVDDISTMLDIKITWEIETAEQLYKIANFCLIPIKKRRPTISEVLLPLKETCRI